MIKIEKLENIDIDNSCLVKLRHCGNIKEIVYTEKANTECYIKKLSDNEYLDLKTGEIKKCNHIENRSQNINSLRKSFKNIRDLINTNCTDNKKIKFITLTYKENMQDIKRLYKDFELFYKKFKYKYKTIDKYINVAEPQQRGAWHLHCIFIFTDNAPKIDFYELKDMWGQGIIKIQNINNVDNIGAYLSAYLSDIELTEEQEKKIDKICTQMNTENQKCIQMKKIIEKEIIDI